MGCRTPVVPIEVMGVSRRGLSKALNDMGLMGWYGTTWDWAGTPNPGGGAFRCMGRRALPLGREAMGLSEVAGRWPRRESSCWPAAWLESAPLRTSCTCWSSCTAGTAQRAVSGKAPKKE